jgi:hypothetical protein
LYLVHEANVAYLWETVGVRKFDKDGNPVLDRDGNAVMEKIQRPRLLSELPRICSVSWSSDTNAQTCLFASIVGNAASQRRRQAMGTCACNTFLIGRDDLP